MNFTKLKTSIKFINHASLIISDGKISVLSDPWYEGDAFHKGWNLLHETNYAEINSLLSQVTHIWISHEHPDHFSIGFFKTFAASIKSLRIKILFQKTKDRRVLNYLRGLGIEVRELELNNKISLSKDYQITCIKDGFYDSGLLIESRGEKILNLNDCEVTSVKRADEIFSLTGNIDVLLTQFSYAAWKGGEKNKKWREEAAKDKINAINIQIDKFRPNFVVPIASYAYFSNVKNFYLNDAVNKPETLKEKIGGYGLKIIVMAPNDVLGGEAEALNSTNAIDFWKRKYQALRPIHQHSTIDLNTIRSSFEKYSFRIEKNNNISLIKLIRRFSPIRAFEPVVILLDDLNKKIKFDYVDKIFIETNEAAMLSMSSDSLDYIFKNTFGFDTLTVNGCFEELIKNGFVAAAKTLALENLNNMGIKIELKSIVRISIAAIFIKRLYRVARKIDVAP